jgi:hypothetical protein
MSQTELQEAERSREQNQREQLPVPITPPPRSGTGLFSRITGIVGICLLVTALFAWVLRPGHYRLVLLILILAMFLAILHNYSIDGRNGKGRIT